MPEAWSPEEDDPAKRIERMVDKMTRLPILRVPTDASEALHLAAHLAGVDPTVAEKAIAYYRQGMKDFPVEKEPDA